MKSKKLLDILNYDFSKESEETKQKVIDYLATAIGSVAMKTFYSLGLKTHISFTIVNDTNGDEFEFNFTKTK